MKKLISKFIRIAASGVTIDGREITRKQIEEMAASYDPKVYGARINTEHFRGLIPGGPFDALGDVVSLKAEEIKDGGELDGEMGLYAQLAPLPALVAMNQAGQKLYTSIEMMTNFAKSGKAYLVGLACTDSPASQGTEMLEFNAAGSDVIAGPSHEVTLDFSEESSKDDTGEGKPTLLSRIQEILKPKKKADDERFTDIDSAVTTIAQSQQESLDTIDQLSRDLEETTSNFTTLHQAHEKLQSDFTALQTQLEGTPGFSQTPRQPASGGDGDGDGKVVTSC
jgi:hypothetical protein